MGGLAFANISTPAGTPPHVPRISPELYKKISVDCQSRLNTLFSRVVIPRDAPGKKDYGDVDFLAGGVKSNVCSSSDIWSTIKHTLGAELHLDRGGAHSFGIPHPEITHAYVQVDVEISPGDGTPEAAELFEWTQFMKGDSDLVQIIGVSHRPLGLTCNDQGLHVRLELIEPYNKKKALLFLTRNPNKMMEFYGFDVAKYRSGFADDFNLFDWATSGRFFSPNVFAARVEKSNDRSRQAKRPMYRRFIEQYMPAHTAKDASKEWSREEVLREALNMFGKHAEYKAMMDEHHAKDAEEQLWMDIRTVIPAGANSMSFVLKGLRRWVCFEDGEPRIAPEAILEGQPLWTTCTSSDDRRRILEWVEDNWKEVKALEKARADAAKEGSRAV